MLHLLVATLLAGASPGASGPAPVPAVAAAAAAAADSLHCRVSAGAGRRCTVAVPAGRSVRACAAKARCDKTRRYVAHVVASGGARCKISKKRTDWARTVVVTMSKKTAKVRGAACDLYVELA